MTHILLTAAVPYKRENNINIPEGFKFDSQRGAWYSEKDNIYLVQHADYPKTGTKKNDIETGEDQKGQ